MTYNPDVLDDATNYPVPHRLLPSQLLNDTSPTPSVSNSASSAARNTPDARQRSAKDLMPYGMKDLTIPSYLRLARRLGKASAEKKKLWKRFTTYMYMTL